MGVFGARQESVVDVSFLRPGVTEESRWDEERRVRKKIMEEGGRDKLRRYRTIGRDFQRRR